ncbi:thiopurine S-methyltransferase [Marinobacter nanhaiticus D15-8W]|uniref:Thiopurine S-methyltransferase n=1 Tax=Marinobacter nanhaiticus D15-8W TaxID=626887 RepID=N6X5F6_9GAMM|nr:thiopurine S-methyltransferase [Marinobacter nanhaiticus]ENO16328.1 thiopurine S-methyltransferase [Marinobacter nanhaiticus D15-8W]BES72813.1 thiopurine S-methyltransferase [Marinobacter nanhaiticus D15-8W]
MEHEFWHARWKHQEIGFHEGTVNRYLHDHWPEMVQTGTETVLVPLCGKAKDMWWLYDRGHPVLGIELSPIACKDFFEEAETKALVQPAQPFIRYIHDELQLWCGDFFQLVPDDVEHVRLVYDRAALIALPPKMRRDYAEHLTAVLPDQARILLITLDYEEGAIKGPPFNVADEEVHQLFGEDFEIEHVLTNPLEKDHPFAKRRGLTEGVESVFKLTRKD